MERELLKVTFSRLFIVLVVWLLLVSCQSTPPQRASADLQFLEAELKTKLEAYLVPRSNLETLAEKRETVYMVDIATGYAYAPNAGLVRLNMFTEGQDGVMRDQEGKVWKVPWKDNGVKASRTELKPLAGNLPTNFFPYRHVESVNAVWKGIAADLELGGAGELEQIGESAFNLLGIRANNNSWTIESGLYANSYTWNSTTRRADYWGAFTRFAAPNGETFGFDYGILTSPVSGQPVVLFKPIIDSSGKCLRCVAIRYYIDAQPECNGSPGDPIYKCGYKKGTNDGYLVFELTGYPTYPASEQSWTYKFVYGTSSGTNPATGTGFKTSFTGVGKNCSQVQCFEMRNAGWKFYRETTLLTLDQDWTKSNQWKYTTLTSTRHVYQGAQPARIVTTWGSAGNYMRRFTKPYALAGVAPGIEQADVTCPAAHEQSLDSRDYSYRRYSDYDQMTAGFDTNFPDFKSPTLQRRVQVRCWTNYYEPELVDIEVY